jgi:hypothetical protein
VSAALRAFADPTCAALVPRTLEHDSEKWVPVLGKDHAQRRS